MTESAGDDIAAEALLASVGRGDREAFRRLYDATAPRLLGIAIRIIGNRPVAEDVVQEAYLKVWRNAGSFAAGSGGAVGWMTAILRNAAIDRIRSDRVERASSGDGDAALAALPDAGAGDSAAQMSLGTCLSQLEDEARHCVVLAYVSGLSREELAARFERPVGTIKTILHRSLRALRQCLDER